MFVTTRHTADWISTSANDSTVNARCKQGHEARHKSQLKAEVRTLEYVDMYV